MIALEVVAYTIVLAFVAVRARYGPDAPAFLRRLALLAIASWIVEDSAIRAYHFYAYAPGWSVFVDHVPLAILLIWPVVIHSSWELARALLGKHHGLVPLVGAMLVWADASLIEPISVASGLWSWTEPGLFEVPPVGLLGWAYYAGFCMWVFQRNATANARPKADATIWLIAPVATHAALLVSWWGLFRWVNVTVAPWPVVALVWVGSTVLTVWAIKSNARSRIPPRDLFTRVPAALFFFALLVLDSRDHPALIAYAFAFAPPYVALTRWRRATPRIGEVRT